MYVEDSRGSVYLLRRKNGVKSSHKLSTKCYYEMQGSGRGFLNVSVNLLKLKAATQLSIIKD